MPDTTWRWEVQKNWTKELGFSLTPTTILIQAISPKKLFGTPEKHLQNYGKCWIWFWILCIETEQFLLDKSTIDIWYHKNSSQNVVFKNIPEELRSFQKPILRGLILFDGSPDYLGLRAIFFEYKGRAWAFFRKCQSYIVLKPSRNRESANLSALYKG